MEKKKILLKDFFKQNPEFFSENNSNVSEETVITPETVYSKATQGAQEMAHKFINSFMKKDSTIVGIEHLDKLSRLSQEGASCLILLEHYSNADYPCFQDLLYRMGHKDLADRLVAMGGVKIYEESTFFRLISKGVNTLFIYPSRSIAKIKEDDLKEKERSSKINLAAMRALMQIKKSGHMILLFPSGTRYRPWAPESKKVVKEVASYLKQFEYCVFVGINGNILRVDGEDMQEDWMEEDTMVFNVSPLVKTEEFVKHATHGLKDQEVENIKMAICEAVEKKLDEMHEEGKKIYLEKIKG